MTVALPSECDNRAVIDRAYSGSPAGLHSLLSRNALRQCTIFVMPLTGYLRELRKKVGHDLLVLPSAAVAINDEQGRVLLGLHADRRVWVLPGGLVEPGEIPADGAVRETWEETGLIVELTSLLGVYGGKECLIEYADGDRASYVGTLFRGRVVGGSLRPDGEEILELRYFSRSEMLQVAHARWLDIASNAIFSGNGVADYQRPTWRP